MSREGTNKTLGRGLTELEVAIIKRMREMNLPRDLIFSYILEPGRKLSPACIAEVEQGKIGADIGMASRAEVGDYMAFRVLGTRSVADGFQSPLSRFRIEQALKWFAPRQGNLFPAEDDMIEYKIMFSEDQGHICKYFKTMAAFANNRGGYIFFGLDDNGARATFDADAFNAADWNRFATCLRETFAPQVRWSRGIYEGENGGVGVVHVEEAEEKPIISTRSFGQAITAGRIYYRYIRESREIGPYELMKVLSDRDERVKRTSQENGRVFFTPDVREAQKAPNRPSRPTADEPDLFDQKL